MTDDWMLRVENLSVRFHTSKGVAHAVDNVSFDIRPGETLAMVGETGCGKSVTARSIVRLVPEPPGEYASGSVLLRREDGSITDILTAPMSEVRAIRGNRISMIFQDPGKALNPSLTIGRQLSEVFAEHRMDMILGDAGIDAERAGGTVRRIAQQRVGKLERGVHSLVKRAQSRSLQKSIDDAVVRALADTGIPNPRKLMSSFPHELSGGMKQRVMIAQALACDPDLLIADEPTTALDVTIQARILDLIHDMQQRRGTAILYITHDLSLVRKFADRVAVMYAGRIVETGPATKVLESPQHPYTQGLLAAIPHSRTPRGELAAIAGSVPQLIAPPPQCHFASRCQWAAPACTGAVPQLLSIGPKRDVACFRFSTAEQVSLAPGDMPVRAEFEGAVAE
jgi:oligopeptide/dipeptide ABC transporter ATP-binding protein